MEQLICGKNHKKIGVTPSIVLINPKYPRNVGAIIRAASCFGIAQVWYTGNRVSMTPTKDYRLPREERMKGYKEVTLTQFDYPFDMFEKAIPIAIEVRENSENLLDFEHPYNAVYVFGPEDGGIERVHMQHCHRIVTIPTKHCTNLAAAVYLTLYDRYAKRVRAGKDQIFNIGKNEQRGYEEGAEFG